MSKRRDPQEAITFLVNQASEALAVVKSALQEGDERAVQDALVRGIARSLTEQHSQLDNSSSNPELDGLTDDGDQPVASLNRKAADAYGVGAARIGVSGSSGINLAIHGFVTPPLMRRGRQAVLVDRSCHMSVVGGLIASGARVVWLHRRYSAEHDVQQPIALGDVRTALDANPDIGAVVATSPTYDGFDIDIEAISALCHDRGVLLIIDGAWGPAYGLMSHLGFPQSAVARGADIAVVSSHKKGFAPSQAAFALFRDAEYARVFDVVGSYGLQTTSPNYVLIGLCEHILDEACEGALDASWAQALKAARGFAARLSEAHSEFREVRAEMVGAASSDPGHVLVHVGRAGLNGFALQRKLSELGLDAEKATRDTLLFLQGPHEASELDEQLRLLAQATRETLALEGAARALNLSIPDAPSPVMSLRRAALSPAVSRPLEEASGRVAAQIVAVYPPGAALVAPGELIGPEHIDYLLAVRKQGGRIRGLCPSTNSIRVVADDAAPESDQ